jgi:predicted phage tail protein
MKTLNSRNTKFSYFKSYFLKLKQNKHAEASSTFLIKVKALRQTLKVLAATRKKLSYQIKNIHSFDKRKESLNRQILELKSSEEKTKNMLSQAIESKNFPTRTQKQNFTPIRPKFKKSPLTTVEKLKAIKTQHNRLKLFASLLRRFRINGTPALLKSIFLLQSKYKKDNPVEFVTEAIHTVTPAYGLHMQQQEQRIHPVPRLLTKKKGDFLALSWIIQSLQGKSKKHQTVPDNLAQALIEITTHSSSFPHRALAAHYQLVNSNIKNLKYATETKERAFKRKKNKFGNE